jgi:transaldolase
LAHDDRSLWNDSKGWADPAVNHPNSPRIIQIIETYKRLYGETGQEQPLVKNASFISPEEAMAAGEMGCHSATISHMVLNELAELTYDPQDKNPKKRLPAVGPGRLAHVYKDAAVLTDRFLPLSLIDPLTDSNKAISIDDAIKVDWLANGGKALDEANAADPQTARRLKIALELFTGGENRSKEKVEVAMKAAA